MSLTLGLGLAIRHPSGAFGTVPPNTPGLPVNVAPPVITGLAQQGQDLTVGMGTWTGSPTGYSVQWQRGSTAITGATAATYTLQAADVGSTIRATVTATNAGGSTPATSASTAAVAAAASGTVVVGLMGQSNYQFTVGATTTWDAVDDAFRPTIDTQNMVFVGTLQNRGVGNDDEYEVIPVTTATVGTRATRTVSAGVGALSAALQHITPGTQFAVVDLAVSGTGRTELLTDDTLSFARGRTWAAYKGMLDFARAQVGEFTEIQEYWYAADDADIPNFLVKFADFYFGENANGSPANIGDPRGAYTLDHILWDITAAPDAEGRGVFARDTTKLRIARGDEDRGADEPAGPLAFAADSRAATFTLPIRDNWVFGARAGGHNINDDPDGAIYTAFNWVPSFLEAAGMTVPRPAITAVAAEPAGAYVDLTISLPNGGNLTTIRALESRADPAAPPADYQEVVGFEVERAGDGIANKLGLINPTATDAGTFDTRYHGTVAITDAGTGVGPARTGTVRITPVTPFATGDQLYYLTDGSNLPALGGKLDRRTIHKTWLNNLIETIPAWRDTSAVTRFPGIAVDPLVTPLPVSLAGVSPQPLSDSGFQASTGVVLPPGLVAGDLMVAVVTVGSNAATPVAPAGWDTEATLVGPTGSVEFVVASRVYQAGDVAPAFTNPGNTVILRYGAGHTVGAIDVSFQLVGTVLVAPALTMTGASSFDLLVLSSRGSQSGWTNPIALAGYTQGNTVNRSRQFYYSVDPLSDMSAPVTTGNTLNGGGGILRVEIVRP